MVQQLSCMQTAAVVDFAASGAYCFSCRPLENPIDFLLLVSWGKLDFGKRVSGRHG